MTREVAEKIVRGITDKIECNTADIDDWAEFWRFTREEYEEFLDMAIEALKAEPCEDCISKQSILDMLDKIETAIEEGDGFQYDDWVEYVNEMQTVTPARKKENQWIKYDDEDSKTWPPDGTWVIWLHKRGGMQIIRWKNDAQNHFYPNDPGWEIEDVVAWMPLPDPYKEVKE